MVNKISMGKTSRRLRCIPAGAIADEDVAFLLDELDHEKMDAETFTRCLVDRFDPRDAFMLRKILYAPVLSMPRRFHVLTAFERKLLRAAADILTAQSYVWAVGIEGGRRLPKAHLYEAPTAEVSLCKTAGGGNKLRELRPSTTVERCALCLGRAHKVRTRKNW